MSKKKIAIIHDRLNIGGTEKALLSMLKFFDYEKYDVTLWLMDKEGDLQTEIDNRVHVEHYSNEGYTGKELIIQYLKNRHLYMMLKSLCFRRKSKRLLNRYYENLKYYIFSLPLITETEYDCLIVYQGLYLQLLATALSRFKAKKRVAWIHMRFNHDCEQIEAFKPLFSMFDKVYCVSDDLRNHYINIYNMPERTEILYNSFDIENIRKEAEEDVDFDFSKNDVLVTVGRISKEKGQLMIPEIAIRLKENGYDFVWLIIGDGAQREQLTYEINKKELSDTVLLLGSKRNPYPYIKNCTIYVQPSLSEGFCTSTMEAKILGKPIVTTNVAGMNEQFRDGYDGIVVKDISPDGIYKRLWVLCSSKELQKELRENTANTLKTFNDELMKFDRFMEDDQSE